MATSHHARSVREVVLRKEELLDRYRAARLEELLREGRAQAVEEAERGRYAWRGEFRPREEILYWYGQRRRWDRRYLLDSTLVVVMLVVLFQVLRMLVQMLQPDPNFPGGGM